ncbi:type II secretion system protein [Ruminococcus flavefaciens]|uniref:type II secretion system protein n=1 Tax=Ruminococcus flavefaciens TaxID=1265 RepID=UPI0002F7459B|nr:prepilin-type N-terminal cleavage/methylation domain-containing protein [Ruminococcus flavefaciens]
MNRKVKKGFTLVELIVVMAIFSILMVGVMAITKPVSAIFRNTSISEKTYSYANNIQTYLQGKLEYSENLIVATSSNMDRDGDGDVDDADIAAWAEKYRVSHYQPTKNGTQMSAVGFNGHDVVYLKGKVHVLRLLNNDDTTLNLKRGEITHRVFDFDTNTPISTLAPYPAEKSELNSAFFDAQDSAYNFSYALGASNLTVAPTPPGGDSNEIYRALDKDLNDINSGISANTLALTIVLDKKNGGSIDVPAGSSGNAYRAFRSPVAIQIANLPLTNITTRNRGLSSSFGVIRPLFDPTNNEVIEIGTATEEECGKGFEWCDQSLATPPGTPDIDFNDDIYFIYSYTDEIELSSLVAN